MKKSSLLFLLLAVAISFSVNAQVFNEVFRNDNLKVKKYQDNSQWYGDIQFIKNFDGDNTYVKISDSNSIIAKIDNNLDVISSTSTLYSNVALFKSDNKFYAYTIGYLEDTISHSYYKNNIEFRCLDSLGNILYSNIIWNKNDDTLEWYDPKVIILKNKECVFTLYNSLFEYAIKLIRVDTLGNVLQTKTHYLESYRYNLSDVDNQILLSTSKNNAVNPNEDNFIYYINNQTLEIEDTIIGYYAYNIKKINDSIFTFSGNNGVTIYNLPYMHLYDLDYLYYMNKNTKRGYPILPFSNILVDSLKIDYPEPVNGTKNIDFITPDSIYSVFNYYKNFDYDYSDGYGFGIVNYNISGDTNFVYKMKFDSACFGSEYNEIEGIKATTDGGLIIALIFNHKAFLAKFMPNGLASIIDIVSGEKESVKVYPNPAKDYVNVDIECTNFKSSDIELFDMQGRIVKKEKLKAKQGNRVDVSSLSAGAYSYNVSLNGKTISGKIIIGK